MLHYIYCRSPIKPSIFKTRVCGNGIALYFAIQAERERERERERRVSLRNKERFVLIPVIFFISLPISIPNDNERDRLVLVWLNVGVSEKKNLR